MKNRQPAAAPTKKGKIWPLEEWKEALFDGEAQRLQERFRKEATAARPRRAAESDAARRARFENEFAKAQEQLIEQGLRKAKVTAAKRSASPSSAIDLLRRIRARVVDGMQLATAMVEEHRRAGHAMRTSITDVDQQAKSLTMEVAPCEGCGDIAQALLVASYDGNPFVDGADAVTIVDKAVEFVQRLDRGLARSVDAPPSHVNGTAEPVHKLTTAQVLANMGLVAQPPAEA